MAWPVDSMAIEALMREVAQDVVMPRYRNLESHEIAEKSVDDLVTIADKESELRLADGLAKILPDAAIVGEEGCADDPALRDRIDSGLAWIIDPIDGTGNFAAGRPPFGIMIALAQDGEAQCGWMLDPLSGRLCKAVRSGGAWIDGERVTAQTTGRTPPLAGISLLFLDAEERRNLIDRAANVLEMIDIPRCAAEQYPRLVLGINDIALFERTLPWDHAAGALFVEEAGGMVARPDGRPYRPDDRDKGLIAAASPALWEVGARALFG